MKWGIKCIADTIQYMGPYWISTDRGIECWATIGKFGSNEPGINIVFYEINAAHRYLEHRNTVDAPRYHILSGGKNYRYVVEEML